MPKGIDNQHRFQENLEEIKGFLHFHLLEGYAPEIPEAITAIMQLQRKLLSIHAKLDRRAAEQWEAAISRQLSNDTD